MRLDDVKDIKRKVVVLGASGYVGNSIVEVLSRDERFIVKGITSKDIDLANEEQVFSKAPDLIKDSIVVMAAAVTPERKEPVIGMLDNIKISANLAGLINRHHLSHVIYLSTIDVYGRENLMLPLDETSRIQPSTYYAISKYTSELILKRVCLDKKIIYTVLRLPGVYGAGDTHESPIKVFIASAIKGSMVRITGDGSQRREFLFINDIPRVLTNVILKRFPGIFNVVTGKSHSINHILTLIDSISNKRLEKIYVKDTEAKLDIVFKKSALLDVLDDFKFTDLSDGLKSTYDYYCMKQTNSANG